MPTGATPQERNPEEVARLAVDFLLRREFVGGKSAERFHDTAKVITGNALSQFFDANQTYSTFSYSNPVANGDSFENYFFLRPGSYTFTVLGVTNTDGGKIDWYMDGVSFTTGQDWYAAALTYKVYKTAAVTVSGGGYHTLKGVVNGQNGASTGFFVRLTKYWFV